MKSKDYLDAYSEVIKKIDEHIFELKNLPGNVFCRDQVISELQLLKSELKENIK